MISTDFAGHKTLVVGGTSGIGHAVARMVLENGGSVVVTGRRSDSTAAATGDLAAFGDVFGDTADLAHDDEQKALVSRLNEKHPDIDRLVNAAGLFLPKPFLEHTEADYDQYLDLNRSMFFITQAVAKNMVASGRGGAIVNIGSMWAKQAVQATPSSAYSMAKAGLHSLTQHLVDEI